MEYKVRYRPIETLGPDGWQRMDEEEQDALIRASLEPKNALKPAEQESFAFTTAG